MASRRGVADERLEAGPVAEVLVGHLVGVQGADVVALQQPVLLVQRRADLAAQDLLVQQVLHADADARVLVDVAGADAAAGGADLELAELLLGGAVQQQVVGHDQVGVAGDAQVVDRHAAAVQGLDLAEEDVRVDHHAVADDARLGLVEDAGGDEVQGEDLAVPHDGVAGVVAALIAHHHVGLLGQQVGDLALALVAPLGADHDGRRHVRSPSVLRWARAPTAPAARGRRRGGRRPPVVDDAARRDHAGGRGLHQAAGDAGAVADGVQAPDLGLQAPVQLGARAVELHLDPVEQRVARVHAGRQGVHRLQHLHDVAQVAVRQREAEVAGRGAEQGGLHGAAHDALAGGALALPAGRPGAARGCLLPAGWPGGRWTCRR